MSPLPGPDTPAGRFVTDMAVQDVQVSAEPGRLLFEVLAVAGPLAGQRVTTAVSLSELQAWPQVPPHWVHLPSWVVFTHSSSDTVDCPPGWVRHSREFALTDLSIPPALSWLRHVRGLLTAATAPAVA